ncbi:MAG: hypothetical protein GTO40_10645 [Deltaproteobacteria bacterium]|nr:hypothetical protein [Deltaproteobacteria bacterium]
MHEWKFRHEVLEASAKLRNSSIDCLSEASFEAARSEQLRLPTEGPLKRMDISSSLMTGNFIEQPRPSEVTVLAK